MNLHLPVAPQREFSARRAAPALDTAGIDATHPLRVALVANGKPNSTELLAEVATDLREQVGHLEVRHYRKGSVSVPLEAHEVREIAEWASAVLAAVGD